MRKYGFLPAFFALLFGFMFFRVVEEESGGGGSDDLDDDLDTDLDDDKDEDEGGDTDTSKDKPPGETFSEEDKNTLEEFRQEKALGSITKDMKAEYGDDFDMDKIVEHLKEMDKKDPGSGQALFNKTGIENIFLKNFQGQSDDGEFGSRGRGSVAPTQEELIGKINKGEASDNEKTAFYSKYA